MLSDGGAPIEIVESFTASKYKDAHANEDALVLTDNFFGVIDGATDISGALVCGESPGRFAARTTARVFDTLTAIENAEDVLDRLTAAMKTAREENGIPSDIRPFCVFAVYIASLRKIIRVGDIQVFVNGQEIPGRIPAVDALIQARCAILYSHLAAGKTVEDLHRNDPSEKLHRLFASGATLVNRDDIPYGFGALDGRPVPGRFIEIIAVPPGAEIIITSDGYPVVKSSLAESEASLAEILQNDPLLISDYPQPRAAIPKDKGYGYDDRSWLKILCRS
ncbi:MAG: hypothetical protein EA357_05720 [Micavibrio sp.]|nr:MAG: hypothetical protein EA357_05720 [Micavibrio sp.]